MTEERRGFAGFESQVTDLSDLPPLPPEPAQRPVGPGGGTPTSTSSGAGAVAAVCFMLFVLVRGLVAFSEHNSPARSVPYIARQPGIGYTPPAVTYTPPQPVVTYTPPQAFSVPLPYSRGPPTPYAEEKPPPGQDISLTTVQLRYCVAQGARLDGSQKAVDLKSKVDVDRFNALVDDFNARCGKYRYSESSMRLVRAEVDARRAQLERDGAALIRSPGAR